MKKPIVALMYDFDKTLSTKDMEEYTLIPAFKMTPDEFWKASDDLAKRNGMDYILSTLLLLIEKSKSCGVDISRESLIEHGKAIELHDGLDTWFERINAVGDSLGLEVRHYIISCGIKPMIEGSSIAKHFTNIFACDYVYDGNIPVWPAMALNYSSKIQFLYRISKGVEDISEHERLNKHMDQSLKPVPFSNMVYIGDGLTDVPSMKLTRLNGGYAVGVYQNKEDSKYLIDDDRVDFYVKADYSKNSEMERVVEAILSKISIANRFKNMSLVHTSKNTAK